MPPTGEKAAKLLGNGIAAGPGAPKLDPSRLAAAALLARPWTRCGRASPPPPPDPLETPAAEASAARCTSTWRRPR